jgi:hypothetical protein
MSIFIIDLIENLNVGKTMNDVQVARAVDLILNEYYFLKPEDFKLCFNNVLTGKYGQVYDRIDTQVLCGWLNRYVSDRLDIADEESYQEHNMIKESGNRSEEPFYPLKNNVKTHKH